MSYYTLSMAVEPHGSRGLNRLASRLTDLTQAGVIGPWHLGPWLDSRRVRRSIHFESAEDARLAEVEFRGPRPKSQPLPRALDRWDNEGGPSKTPTHHSVRE